MTERTKKPEEEQLYESRTTTEVYQALSLTNPPGLTRLVYALLPAMIGSLFLGYVRGVRSGVWKARYAG